MSGFVVLPKTAVFSVSRNVISPQFKSVDAQFTGLSEATPEGSQVAVSKASASQSSKPSGFRKMILGLLGISTVLGGVAGCTDTGPGAATANYGNQSQATQTTAWFGKDLNGNLEGKTMNISTRSGWMSETMIGTMDDAPLNLNIAFGWMNYTITGQALGANTDLTHTSGMFSSDLKGSMLGQTVNVTITPGFMSKSIKGTFCGKSLDVTLKPQLIGRVLEGTFNGKPLKIEFSPLFTGEKIHGEIDGGKFVIENTSGFFSREVQASSSLSKEAKAACLIGSILDQHSELIHPKPSNNDSDSSD
jgi:hypothetical protein